ncbi:hypothetical protein BH23ACT5_BH23ACT5_15380 [soil metagenome]
MRRFSGWMNRRPGWVLAAVVGITAVLVLPFLTMAPTESASTEPRGPVFEARDLVEERFVSSVLPNFFIVADQGGDMLRAEPMRQLLAAGEELRSHPELGGTLFAYYDPTTETEIHGLLTLADLIDRLLPEGLASATDVDVRTVGSALIDRLGPEAAVVNLSTKSVQEADGTWTVPAISVLVLSDTEVLGFGSSGVNLGGDTGPEEYARDVQSVLRTAGGLDVYGVAIDVNLTSQEQGAIAGPFIGLTIFAVLLIVGLTFRSYWVLAIVGAALGAVMIWLKGISNLIGLQDDLVLSLIVPIAMISFGVDFAFHGVGRYREERTGGHPARAAYVAGITAVSGALLLALVSDAAAFLANVTSGIESIVQFGIGAAVALGSAYLLLGLVTPLFVAVVESQVPPPRPGRSSTVARVVASVGAALLYMGAVLLMVFVLPWAGVAALGAAVVATVLIPYLVQRRRTGAAAPAPSARDALGRPVGAAIAAIARWRVVVVPAALAVSVVAAYFALQVQAEFDVEDFFAADTDFVIGLDLLDEHIGDRGGEPAVIYVEGPLEDPAALARLDARLDDIRNLDTEVFARNNGEIQVWGGVFGVFESVLESPAALGLIAQRTGVEITDADSDGIPDSREQIEAVYAVTAEVGVPLDAQRLTLTPDDVRTSIAVDARGLATKFEIGLVNSRAQAAIEEGRDLLAPIVAAISEDLGGSVVQATGGPFVRQESLDATNRALQVSLPVAALLCVIIATVFLRSFRFGLVSVVPILMTVSWLYAFMERAGYAINIVTATIAAVSIGIGIDFAIHYIARYREELDRLGERMAAVRHAGEGTGSALVASALSSVIGFGILALAPMPLFATYGFLTAVMIVLALAATLVVLPGMLVMITRDAEPEPAAAPVSATVPIGSI